jgi:hypothetical protein
MTISETYWRVVSKDSIGYRYFYTLQPMLKPHERAFATSSMSFDVGDVVTPFMAEAFDSFGIARMSGNSKAPWETGAVVMASSQYSEDRDKTTKSVVQLLGVTGVDTALSRIHDQLPAVAGHSSLSGILRSIIEWLILAVALFGLGYLVLSYWYGSRIPRHALLMMYTVNTLILLTVGIILLEVKSP